MNLDIKFSELASLENEAVYERDFAMSQLCTDTRSIQRGDTYLAIKGERFDGHEFIGEAISSGASSLVVSDRTDFDVPSIKVANTVVSLGNIAKIHRKRLTAKVVGITGSNGKTTVKEMVSLICRERGDVIATTSNNNNMIGVPLTLLSASSKEEFVVVEMGTSEPGEISYLSGIVEPDVSVITNVSESHLDGLGSRRGVFDEKSAIIPATSDDGTVVVNQDDGYSEDAKRLALGTPVLTYGFTADANVNGVYENTETGVKVSAQSPAGKLDYGLLLPGRHNVANSFAAVAIGCALGIETEPMIRGLEKFPGEKSRLQMLRLGRDVSLIDDTYNANPGSSMAALEVLCGYRSRKIFVFSGMAELGEREIALHKLIGRKAHELGIDVLFGCGELAAISVKAFGGDKFYFNSADELLPELLLFIRSGDVVLVKGSRKFHMGRIVQRLAEELA